MLRSWVVTNQNSEFWVISTMVRPMLYSFLKCEILHWMLWNRGLNVDSYFYLVSRIESGENGFVLGELKPIVNSFIDMILKMSNE